MNLRPLIFALADGRFHSGTDLGRELGISRAAVWKQVRELRDLGVEVHAVRGRGYCMPDPVRLLEARQILARLGAQSREALEDFVVHFSIDSTNAEAMRRIRRGTRHCVIMAEHQSGGRGRRGRGWVSPLGHNIYLSAVWSFRCGVAALEGLSLICGLAVAGAAERVAGEEAGGRVTLKWPNDVLLDGRKVAGILLEVSGGMEGACQVVIGIGVNVSMPRQSGAGIDQPWAALSEAGPRAPGRDELAASLVEELVQRLKLFEVSGFAPFRREWESRDHYLGVPVRITGMAGSGLTGTEQGVDDSGRLRVRRDDGLVETLAGGELSPGLRPLSEPAGADYGE